MGDLFVAPGVTIDGYDISVLGQAISNLQAADTIARTGWTAFTHSTHLVSTIDANATEILVRDSIFTPNEQLALSNTNGEIEFMRVIGEAVQTLDNDGRICYQYTVTRRISTSPSGLNIGWAAATLVNGMTEKGYITIDNRHANSTNSPNITGALWLDNTLTAVERIFRLGDLKGVLDITSNDFGFAVGSLDTRSSYMLFNGSRNSFLLRNAGIDIFDADNEQVVKIYGANEDDRLAGDYDFGKVVRNSFYGEPAKWGLYRNDSPIMEITDNHSFLRDLFIIGDPVGARITLGEIDDSAVIALRNKFGAIKALFSTDENGDVFAHIGNAPPEANSVSYDGTTGLLNIDGHVTMRSASVVGRLEFATTGEFMVIDPDHPGRFGVTTPRGQYAYTTDSTGTTHLIRVDAWGPLVLEDVLGSGVWRTWVGGSQIFGDPRYRHFRIERGINARAGLFNGETPVAYLDAAGTGYFSGIINAQGGLFSGDVEITTGKIVWDYGSISSDGLVFDVGGFDLETPNSSVISWQTPTGILAAIGSNDTSEAALYIAVTGNNITQPGRIEITATSGSDEGLLLDSEVYLAAKGALGSYSSELQLQTIGVLGFASVTADYITLVTAEGETTIGDGVTNYSQFDSAGHLTFAGTAKPWNDMLIEPSARNTGANAPTFEKWYVDSAGTSRGVYLYSFDDANVGSEKEVFFTMQMSHAWDGGNIYFHVHWVGAVDDTAATPRWGLEYTWKEPGGVFGDTTVVYATGNHLGEANITADKHYITQFTALSPGSTADDLSSVLIGRLFRDSANAADTYNATGAKVGLLYIDAHYQMARIGSNDEYEA
jgi:hypothetical protein